MTTLRWGRRLLACLPGWPAQELVIPAPEMRRLLAAERTRLGPPDERPSVLIFRLPAGEGQPRAWLRLARTLLRQVRSVAAVGWLDADRLAALLPRTSPPGARRLGEKLVARLATPGRSIPFTVCQPSAGSDCSEEGIELPDWVPVIGPPEPPEDFDQPRAAFPGWR